jgi:hypothetical protein
MDAIALLLQVDWPLSDVWGSGVGFIAFMVAGIGAMGLASRSLSVGIMGAILTFAYYATETSIVVLETTLYVVLTLIIVGMSFKLWRTEASLGGE